MTLEQKSELSKLLEALKKADKDLEIYLEAENQGLISGDASIEYKKGEHCVYFNRKFELYSQTLGADLQLPDAEYLINQIENCINENDDNLVTELISVIQKVQEEYTSWEIISTDSYEYSDELDMHTMDDDEIPDEILDDDEQISTSKLEENGWEFGVSGGGTSVYNADSTELLEEYYELSSITIKFDDKSFTFSLD